MLVSTVATLFYAFINAPLATNSDSTALLGGGTCISKFHAECENNVLDLKTRNGHLISFPDDLPYVSRADQQSLSGVPMP